MYKLHSQQNQNITNQVKTFQRIYQQKFSKSHTNDLIQRRRITAFQFRPSKGEKEDEENEMNTKTVGNTIKTKSKSVGSLLPRIKEIEMIAKSQKADKSKNKSKQLSNFELYLSQKFIKKQQQLNMLFLTQSAMVIPDKVINQKFNQFVAVHQENRPKNLRALLTLTNGSQYTEQGRKKKVQEQKSELLDIAKGLIAEQLRQKQANFFPQSKQSQYSVSQKSESSHRQKQKNIDWVLNECKKFSSKFKLAKKKKKIKEGNEK